MNELTRHLWGRFLWQGAAIVTFVVLAAVAYHSLSGGLLLRPEQWSQATTKAQTQPGDLTAEEVALLIRRPDVMVLDARPAPLFLAGHIPGARHLSLARFVKLYRLKRPIMAHASIIVVYGASDDNLGIDLARRLRRDGLEDVRVFKAGVNGWRKSGRPLETGHERPR